MKNVILLLVMAATVSAVGQEQNKSDPTELDWLKGSWYLLSAETTVYEVWKDDSLYYMSGYGAAVTKSDSIVTETMCIVLRNDSIFLSALVPDQNNGEAVIFQLIDTDPVTFHNPDHDYPNMIIYEKQDDGRVLVTIKDDAGKNEQGYIMTKLSK